MGGVQRFEDLVAWQKARELTREIYRVSKNGRFARNFGLGRQIQMSRAEEVGRLVGGLRASIERQKKQQQGLS